MFSTEKARGDVTSAMKEIQGNKIEGQLWGRDLVDEFQFRRPVPYLYMWLCIYVSPAFYLEANTTESCAYYMLTGHVDSIDITRRSNMCSRSRATLLCLGISKTINIAKYYRRAM